MRIHALSTCGCSDNKRRQLQAPCKRRNLGAKNGGLSGPCASCDFEI
ncbi:hypothetical protein PC128_g24811 [Phytophthora cactorum]|nr:hypothetical protein PC120_g24132 [Phytophthora cactorum]KAG3142271.1 hypothetical protein PC128_g24811 [Phytophthora cactorum]